MKYVDFGAVRRCNFSSENEILREGNISLEILRDKLKTRVSDLEEELRRLRDELEESVSRKETRNADDEVMAVMCRFTALSIPHSFTAGINRVTTLFQQ